MFIKYNLFFTWSVICDRIRNRNLFLILHIAYSDMYFTYMCILIPHVILHKTRHENINIKIISKIL